MKYIFGHLSVKLCLKVMLDFAFKRGCNISHFLFLNGLDPVIVEHTYTVFCCFFLIISYCAHTCISSRIDIQYIHLPGCYIVFPQRMSKLNENKPFTRILLKSCLTVRKVHCFSFLLTVLFFKTVTFAIGR